MEVLIQILTSPFIQLFILGLLAGGFKSDLELPEALTKSLSIYLMLAIGMKGGLEIAHTQADSNEIILLITVAIAMSFLTPYLCYYVLRKTTAVSRLDAAAISAHYGSVSAVTFSFALAYLKDVGVHVEGYAVTLLAVMEFPAILGGLMLAKRSVRLPNEKKTRLLSPKILQEVFLNGSVFLLLGGMVIGATASPEGMAKVKPYLIDPFNGILCLFLLELGLLASKEMKKVKDFSWQLAAFGVYMPIILGLITFPIAILLGFTPGDTIILAILGASASYIAVPAAMKIALPEANPAYYITLSLCITFPLTMIFYVPLFTYLGKVFIGV
jgi:uncharacterized protein